MSPCCVPAFVSILAMKPAQSGTKVAANHVTSPGFRSRAMSAMTRDSGDRRALRAQPQFDRTVTDRSKSLFGLVSTSNPVVSFPAFADRHFPIASRLLSDEHPANHPLRVAQLDANVKRILKARNFGFGALVFSATDWDWSHPASATKRGKDGALGAWIKKIGNEQLTTAGGSR